jgi:hypothetical protein
VAVAERGVCNGGNLRGEGSQAVTQSLPSTTTGMMEPCVNSLACTWQICPTGGFARSDGDDASALAPTHAVADTTHSDAKLRSSITNSLCKDNMLHVAT